MEGGLVLALLLELLSQLEQALPPPVQHPQLRAGPAVPPIRASAGRRRISSSSFSSYFSFPPASQLKHHR